MNVLLRPGAKALGGLVLLIVLTACASSREGVNVMRTAGGGQNVQLTVENNDFRDASIYASWNGMRERVGMVTGKTRETFEMRWRSEQVRLEVDFIGGGGFWSDVIEVYEGDHLNFVILPRS